ncbi:transposase [Streptomyces sp. NPDC001549]|uniref:transposase n=1 Tax=Streptomyces sp. NPDC001549 TaxID=3364586 RepID=UPI0036A0B70C
MSRSWAGEGMTARSGSYCGGSTPKTGTGVLGRPAALGVGQGELFAGRAGRRITRSGRIRPTPSVGYALTEPLRRAVRAMPAPLWHPALNQDGTVRAGAEVAELAGMIDMDGYPAGTCIIVRRERPHPGAQLSLFDQGEGLRRQVFLTGTPSPGGGSAQFPEVRHRGHARVEDHIRCGKTTGFGRFPSRDFNINAAWLELSLAAIDLLAWTRVLLLDCELASAEPKKLRYRLLYVAARLTRGGRRLRLRMSATWPWSHELATATRKSTQAKWTKWT